MSQDPDDDAQARELPIVEQQAPPERADAARNRAKIVATAEQMVVDDGVQSLSMHAIASAAGVGVGTIYRRFGNIGGIAEALVDAHERRLQQEFLGGAPPLGPGAPPVERIRAFLHAYIDLLDRFAELMVVAETTMPTTYLTSGAYPVHHTHLSMLITEARPNADAQYLAHTLLAAVSANLFLHQRRREGMTSERVKDGIDDLLLGLPH